MNEQDSASNSKTAYLSTWDYVGLCWVAKALFFRSLFCEDKIVKGYGYTPLQAFNAFTSMKQQQYNIDCGK